MDSQKKNQVKFKSSTTVAKNAGVADRKFSRADVNTIIGKLKKKFEKEKEREQEELNAIVNAIDEPMDDEDLESILNETDDQE